MIKSILTKHNGTYKLSEILYARSKIIVRIYDNNVKEITLAYIDKLKKCINLESIIINIHCQVSDFIMSELFSLKVVELAIQIMTGKINIPKNFNNDKLKDLSIHGGEKAEICFIPKKILDLKLRSLVIGGLIVLEAPHYFPNLFNYHYLIVMNCLCYNHYLFNGEDEMYLNICSEKIKERVMLFNENYFIPETTTKLKINMPIIDDSNSSLHTSIVKLMNNLPNSIEILIVNLFLPCPDYFQNLPIGLKELHINKSCELLLKNIEMYFKIPINTEVKFF